MQKIDTGEPENIPNWVSSDSFPLTFFMREGGGVERGG